MQAELETPLRIRSPEEDAQARAMFNEYSPIPDDEFMRLVTRKLPNIKTSYIQFESGPDIPHFLIGCRGDLYHGSFKIDFRNGVTAFGGSGENRTGDRVTGRKMHGNFTAASFAVGASRYNIHAASSMGGWVWALSGMKIEEEEVPYVSPVIQEKLNLLQSQMDYAEYLSLFAVAKLSDKTDLRTLAKEGTPVKNARHLFTKASFYDPGHAGHGFDYYCENGFFKNGVVSRGKFLLTRLSYPAYADRHDAEQIKILSKETGVPIMALVDAVTQPTQSVTHSSTPASRTAHPL